MPMAKKEAVSEGEPDPVVSRLDVLISLLMAPANKHADQVSPLQFQILALCDYEHTTDEIVKATKKTSNHITKELSVLRSKGMIRTVNRDGRAVHVRI
jgi:DNA-binding MarR family transcriptional regulator